MHIFGQPNMILHFWMLCFMCEPPKEEFGMTFFDIDQGFNGAGIEEVRIEVGPSGSVNKTTLEKPKSLSKVLSRKTRFEQPGSEKPSV